LRDRRFFITEDDFRVWLPTVEFGKSDEVEDDAYNSRKISGIMSTPGRDRQGEVVVQKGLDFEPFLRHGHFNDNHSQSTSAVLGYPEEVKYSSKIQGINGSSEGWLVKGYLLKGTKRADDVWELAKALAKTPDRRLGFSIEGKVARRSNHTIHKAIIRNMAITNCPVNTECTWDVIEKSFYDEDMVEKSLSAGYGAAGGPAAQSGGSALGSESLERDGDERDEKTKRAKRTLKIVQKSLGVPDLDDLLKAIHYAYELQSDLTEEAAASLITHLHLKGVK
jgi:hypothetical protein